MKIDPRSISCYFIGNPKKSRGYKFNLQTATVRLYIQSLQIL